MTSMTLERPLVRVRLAGVGAAGGAENEPTATAGPRAGKTLGPSGAKKKAPRDTPPRTLVRPWDEKLSLKLEGCDFAERPQS
jgi:hypothetical protein